MAINLITGYAGAGHITSADAGRFNAGICGPDKYVMNTGDRFAYVLESNNKITIKSGDAVNQGRHISIPYGTYETLNIENGSQGKSRIDIVALRYERKISTGIETAVIKIVKGTEVFNGNPTPPSLETGNILAGDAVDEMLLYYIYITDLSVTRVQQVFNTVHSLNSMWDYIYPVGSIYMSVNDVSPSVLFGGSWEQINDRFLLAAGGKKAGTEGGAEQHKLAEESLPLHTHTVPKHTHTATIEKSGLHQHGVNRCRNAASGTARFAAQYTENSIHHTTMDGEHSHNVIVENSTEFETAAAGEGKAFDIMPPYLAVYMWKRIN